MAAEATEVDPRTLRRAVTAAAVGNAMEWFDFGVFAYLVTTLGQVFFAPGGATIQTFALFAAAFVARPIGGLFFGAIGDRLGRQRTLAATMLTMAAASMAIGFLPSYATVGSLASVLLLIARLVQGFSTGGEYGGATTFVSEYAPDDRRGMYASWLEFGTLAGFVLGSGLVTVLTVVLEPGQLTDWGWRVPFLLGGPLGAIGLYLRLRLDETPAFEQAERSREKDVSVKRQFRETVVEQARPMLLCVALVIAFNVTDYLLLSYMPTYLTEQLGMSETTGLLILLVVMLAMMAVIVFMGRLSDRYGRRVILATGCLNFFVFSVPAFLLIRNASTVAVLCGTLALGGALVCFTSTMPSALPALFPTGVRYGALSVGFNVSVSLFGGTTPLVVAGLISLTGSNLVPAFYLMVAAAIGAVAVWFMRETAQEPLAGEPPTVEAAT